MNEQELLAQIGRTGWSVVGRRPETKRERTVDARDNPVTTDQPTGNIIWTISGPNGQTDAVTVGVSGTGGPSSAYQYTVVEGPKRQVQQTPAPRNAQTVTIGGTVYERDASGKWQPASGIPSTDQNKPEVREAGGAIYERQPDGSWKQVVAPARGTPNVREVGGKLYQYNDESKKWEVAIDVPEKPKEPTTRELNGSLYQWNTTSQKWEVAVQGQQKPETRELGGQLYERQPDGTWKPVAGPEKPKEGDTRKNVQAGYEVQEVYKGGQWIVDPSVPPKRYTPQAPTTVSAGAEQEFILQQNPQTGAVTQVPNPNYRPKDTAARVGQLEQQAKAKRDALQAEVLNGSKTREQAEQEFNNWWGATVDPAAQQITQAQQQTDLENQIKVRQEQRADEAAQVSRFSTAQTAGQNAVRNVMDTMPYRVGPGFGAAVNQIAGAYSSGKMPGNLDIGSAVTFDMPDLNAISQKATADALAHLSPTAAGITGGAMPQIPRGIDVGSILNRSQYSLQGGLPGGAPPAPAPPPAQAPTTTIAPDGTVTITHAASQAAQTAGSVADFGSLLAANPLPEPFTGEVPPGMLD